MTIQPSPIANCHSASPNATASAIHVSRDCRIRFKTLATLRTIGFLVLPAWLLMRVAGQWIDSREDIPGDPAWLGVGFLVGDAGLVLLVITALIAWWGVRRPERRWPVRAVAVISGLYLIALFVAMWAMTTKPD